MISQCYNIAVFEASSLAKKAQTVIKTELLMCHAIVKMIQSIPIRIL